MVVDPFEMSEGTFNELQETLIDDLFSGSTSGTIGYHDGVSSFTEETVEQKAAQRLKDQQFLDRLKAVVEIVLVMELAALQPAKREPLEEVCGSYGAETMLLASHPESASWTDDLIQAELAKTEFGVKRAWTEIDRRTNDACWSDNRRREAKDCCVVDRDEF